MQTDALVLALLESYRQGERLPQSLRGKLDRDEGYRAQLGLLAHQIEAGERQVGWKVGLTADSIRQMFASHEPVFGYLLASASKRSGGHLRVDGLQTPMIENEIMVTLSTDLFGPGVAAGDARNAIATIAPALEIIERRGADMRVDVPLAIADNVAQAAFVHGTPVVPASDFDFGKVQAQVRINGQLRESALGSDVMDNQLQTIAWLANALHRFGRGLRAGDVIMTGSFTKPIAVAAGDVAETTFSGVGVVSAKFD